jgi:hypothetical protein
LISLVSAKTRKTFLATYAPAGGVIRVVLVKEEHSWCAISEPTWLFTIESLDATISGAVCVEPTI